MTQEIKIILDEDQLVSIEEMCKACHVESALIIEFVEYEIINPRGHEPSEWQFKASDLQRLQKALRLHQDLKINYEGLPVVLNLIDEVEELRLALQHFKKMYGS